MFLPFSVKNWGKRLCWAVLASIIFLGLSGCTAGLPPVDETISATPTPVVLDPIETVAPEPTNTLLPVVIYEPTAVPLEVIPTATTAQVEATETATPSATPIPPDPTETAIPTETAYPTIAPAAEVLEGGCRPLRETINYTNPFIVTDDLPVHIPRSTEILIGYGGAEKLIHLGFDVERVTEYVTPLLNVLDRRQVKSTMFIVGEWAEFHPEKVIEIDERGHEIANHTYTHLDLTWMTEEEIRDELATTEAIVQGLLGKTTKPFMRPPTGARNARTIQVAYEMGYSTVIWSGSTEDWRPDANADTMCKTLLDTSYPGGILYSHTWHPDTPEAIDRYIGEMQARGYTFVPLSVILSDRPQDYLIPNQ